MTSRYTASHRDVVKSRNQASAFVNHSKCNTYTEKPHQLLLMRKNIFSVELQKILHRQNSKVTHPRNLKIPENQVLTQDNVCDTQESVQEACIENINPQVINRNRITRRKMKNHLISAFPAVLGLSVKIILSQSRLFLALTQQGTAHTVSSTFCPHYRALQCLFLGASVCLTIS